MNAAILARSFNISGGHIRNIALSAAYLAAEDGCDRNYQHIRHAASREYRKMGRLVPQPTF